MKHVMQNYFENIVQEAAALIKFDSSLKPAEGNYPFGKETADCLAYFLSLAKDMGFETHNYDNYVGEVVYGEGEEFAILAHLDVVPAGDGWKYPPFGAVINDDVSASGVVGKKLWGRGAEDDKTPAVACLFALKALKDQRLVPQRKIKLIVGCNEEAGWGCIDHYNKVAKMPDEGFTPDADFPAIYAEKGIFHFTMQFPIENAPFTALEGGTCANMVCGALQATLTKRAGGKLVGYENPVNGTQFSYDNTTNILRVRGKSAHGSTPQNGANALEATLKFFAEFNPSCKRAYNVLFADELGLKTLFDETGYLTMSPDMATYKDGILYVTTDIRYPATLDLSEVTERLNQTGLTYVIDSHKAALYNDPNGALIATLTKVYNEATGTQSSPIAIGGGTYARALKNGCGFGPYMEGCESVAHQPNEYILLEHIRFMSEVYYDAISALTTPKKLFRICAIKCKQ